MADLLLVGSGGLVLKGGGVITSSIPTVSSIVADVSTGGFGFGGEGVFTEVDPLITEIGDGDGGFAFGGAGAFGITRPEHRSFVGDGGFKIGGKGSFSKVLPTDTPSISFIGSIGFGIGGAGVITSSRPKSFKSLIGTGGFKFGGFRIPPVTITRPGETKVAIGKVAAFGLGGEGAWSVSKPGSTVIVSNGAAFKLAGSGSLNSRKPPVTHILGEGGFALSGEGESADNIIFDAWALSGNNHKPSYYSGFNFNSFAQFQGQFWGSKDDGLYLMDGDDDDGLEIHSGVRIGPTNFGTLSSKRLRTITIGDCGEKVKVRVQAKGREGIFQVVQGKADISRNLEDREMTIDIADFDELAQIEILPLVMAR